MEAEKPGGATGVRLSVDDENADEPWKMMPSRRRQAQSSKEPMPARVDVVLGDQVYVDRSGLPSSMVAQLVRVAAFQNPEFYRAQAMRLPTFCKPRVISCAELHPRHVGLPRGCLDEAVELLKLSGATAQYKDERETGRPLDLKFLGTLHDIQAAAVAAIERHDYGVLAATTAFGKTTQYVGRLHREHHAKREVVVYDYVDSGVPMLARMALKRQSGYHSLGYEVAAK